MKSVIVKKEKEVTALQQFIKGADLCRSFFSEVVRPVLDEHFPKLSYSAGLLGYGSDVLGYDDPVSTDHMWGPRFYLFLKKEDLVLKPQLLDVFSSTFPYTYRGYSVHFSPPDPNDGGVRHAIPIDSGKVNPLVFIYSFEEYLDFYLGTHELDHLSDSEWLAFSEHRLLALSRAEWYADKLELAKRLEPIRYYPETVWLFLIASNWSLLAEEQAFVRRCADTGDDTGSILVCARMAERLMRLAFLYCKQYAPYSKWFGTAFSRLPINEELKTSIHRAVSASEISEREDQLVRAQQLLAQLHNSIGITEPVSDQIVSYFGRKIKVIYADRIASAVRKKLCGTSLEHAPLIGSLSEVANFTTLYENVSLRPRVQALYTEGDKA